MPIKLMFLVATTGFLIVSGPASAASYYIYCANNMINVSSRSVATLKRSFADVCQLSGPMDQGSASQRAIQRFGGENARCSCR